MSDGGYLEISKTVFGSKRSILIESLGDGKVKKEYYEGRTKMPWEPNGKQWLSEILPEVVRTSTIGAESRVKRFFRKGGTNAVLAEIDNIDNDHVKAHYGKLLMKEPVQPGDYATIVTQVTESLDSDHYITEFLQSNVQKFLQQKFGNRGIDVRPRKQNDSVEVYLGEEFLGLIYADDEDGERSYNFQMAILDVDLEDLQ